MARYLALALAVALSAGPASAHHSYAMFDRTKQVTLSGTVKDFQWANPHIYMWLEAADDKGKAQLWTIEGGSPNILERQGWSKSSIKVGDAAKITINPLKDGRTGGYFVRLTRPDGSILGDNPNDHTPRNGAPPPAAPPPT